MKSLFTLLTLSLAFVGWSQKPNPCDADSLKDPYSLKSLHPLLTRRNNTLHFRNTLELISEPSTISGAGLTEYNSGGKKSYILHADIQMPIALGGKRYSFGGSGNKFYWMNTIQAIPQFKVRIFQNDVAWGDSSLPVRTPSYLPRISYFGAPSCLWHYSVDGDTVEHEHFYFMGASVYHHSNGQDGTEFRGDSVNIYNGNFGENAVFQFLIGGHYRIGGKQSSFNFLQRINALGKAGKMGKTLYTAQKTCVQQSWKAGFEWHPPALSNKPYATYGVYGGNRVQGQYTLIISPMYQERVYHQPSGCWLNDGPPVQKELFRLVATLEYITDRSFYKGNLTNLEEIKMGDAARRMNVILTSYFRIPGAGHAAGFLSIGYWGSDNYNVYFQKQMVQIRGGFAFAFFDYPNGQRRHSN